MVLLGGPGSGKTTLVKRLARSLALGAEVAAERCPDLPWALPVVIPVALFDDWRRDGGILDYVRHDFERRGGGALRAAFDRRVREGRSLLLLDGLDEVADAGDRIGCARAVGSFLSELGGNRVLVTSRPVGYSICRLSVPAEHVLLQPFSSGDIATFVEQWHVAYYAVLYPEWQQRTRTSWIFFASGSRKTAIWTSRLMPPGASGWPGRGKTRRFIGRLFVEFQALTQRCPPPISTAPSPSSKANKTTTPRAPTRRSASSWPACCAATTRGARSSTDGCGMPQRDRLD